MFCFSPYSNPLIFTPAKIHPSSLLACSCCLHPHITLYKNIRILLSSLLLKQPKFFNCCVFLYNLATSFPQNFPFTPRFCAIMKHMNWIPTSRITDMFPHLPPPVKPLNLQISYRNHANQILCFLQPLISQ